MSYYITFKGVTSTSKNVEIVRRPSPPAPEPRFEPYIIPGRDGYLMPNEITYAPIEIEVEMNFMSSTPDTWGADLRAIRSWLYGSGELYLSDDPNVFYNVYSVRIEDLERTSRRIGTFTAIFLCDPYQYIVTSDLTVQPNHIATFVNQYMTCYPIYHVVAVSYVAQTTTFIVNGTSFNVPTNCYIDTESGIIRKDTTGQIINASTVGDLSQLCFVNGSNTIASTASASLIISPKRRTL